MNDLSEIDHAELWAAASRAEAVAPGLWRRGKVRVYNVYADSMSEEAVAVTSDLLSENIRAILSTYIAAASPDVVLGLLEKVAGLSRLADDTAIAWADALTENAKLRAALHE